VTTERYQIDIHPSLAAVLRHAGKGSLSAGVVWVAKHLENVYVKTDEMKRVDSEEESFRSRNPWVEE